MIKDNSFVGLCSHINNNLPQESSTRQLSQCRQNIYFLGTLV